MTIDMTITPNRNDPATVSWLDRCRAWRPELSTREFEKLIPDLIKLGMGLQAAKRLGELH